MSSIFTLVHVLGLVALGFSGLMTSCLATSYFNHDGATQAFWDSTVIAFCIGTVMFLSTYKSQKKTFTTSRFLVSGADMVA